MRAFSRAPLHFWIPLLLVAGGTAWIAGPLPAQEEWRWEGEIAPGDRLEIKGVNGEITAAAAPGGRAVVEAARTNERGDPTEVRIEVVEHADGVTVCAVYPSPPGRGPNECRPGDEGRMHVRKNETFVRFEVRVPAGVELVARNVNGGIVAQGLESDVHARTVNGDVRVETTGSARARTVNGSISARLGRLGTGDLSFRTVNGGIELRLPEGAGARLRAETVHGEIDSELPLTLRGTARDRHWGPRKLEATVGEGGPRVELRTVNGSIRLRRG